MAMAMVRYDTFVAEALSAYKYRHIKRTKLDASAVLKKYSELKPVKETYVFNNGVQTKLVAICGTVPIRYQDNMYNIPIYVWLLDTHPCHAPIVYVKPTADMRIKVSRQVDHNGKVYMEYLRNWKESKSGLLALIKALIVMFEEQPPVYSVSPRSSTNFDTMGEQGSTMSYLAPPEADKERSHDDIENLRKLIMEQGKEITELKNTLLETKEHMREMEQTLEELATAHDSGRQVLEDENEQMRDQIDKLERDIAYMY